MPSKCFASWASPNWTRPPRRRDKNRSCSDQPQNPPPYLLGVTGHNVKHALARAQIHHVHIGPQTCVVCQVPSIVVGVQIDHDVIAVPEPIGAGIVIVRCRLKKESAYVEAIAIASV